MGHNATAEVETMSIEEVLQGVSLLDGLSPFELSSVAQVCLEKSYRQGELVFSEGSTGDELYIVKSGRVALQKAGRGFEPAMVFHYVEPGQVFGELALIDRENRSAGAKAITDCEILILPREDLHRVFEMSHRIGYLVMHNTAAMLSSRLRKTNLQLLASESWK